MYSTNFVEEVHTIQVGVDIERAVYVGRARLRINLS